MALLNSSTEAKKFDTRMVERNLDRGVIQSKDLTDALKSLPDDSQNAEFVALEAIQNDEVPPKSVFQKFR